MIKSYKMGISSFNIYPHFIPTEISVFTDHVNIVSRGWEASGAVPVIDK